MQNLTTTSSSDRKKVIVWTFGTILLYSELYASVMVSIYAKLSSHLAVRKRERGCTHARNCVYLSKMKNSSYCQELVSHPMSLNWVVKSE